jgi:hypothetical protein
LSALVPHPEPPANLSASQLPLFEIDASWSRIHQSRHSPLFFGKSGNNRYDAPAQEYGVMYVAADPHGAFIETFGSQTGVRVVSRAELALRSISTLACNRPLNLVDFTGSGLARLGADGRLCTGDHDLAQRWAWALWQCSEQVDGIYYRARHDLEQPCAAIFSRAEAVFEIATMQGLVDISFQKMLGRILDTYQFGLIR